VQRVLAAGLLAGALATAAEGAAQQPQQNFLPVGTVAPDVTLRGALAAVAQT
jgi:hypothetical protein